MLVQAPTKALRWLEFPDESPEQPKITIANCHQAIRGNQVQRAGSLTFTHVTSYHRSRFIERGKMSHLCQQNRKFGGQAGNSTSSMVMNISE
jgi:hypothetical protein